MHFGFTWRQEIFACSPCCPQQLAPCQAKAMSTFVLHVDVDCFFAAVERAHAPALKGCELHEAAGHSESMKSKKLLCVTFTVPLVVQQHADIICVSYEARRMGVKKHMLPSDVRKQWAGAVRLVHCETLQTGKVTYRRYRAASRRLFKAIGAFLPEMDIPMQTMSFDECFLDVSGVIRQRIHSQQACLAAPSGALSLSDASDASMQDTGRPATPSSAHSHPPIPWSAAHGALLRLAQQLKAWVTAHTGLPVSVGGGSSKLLAKLASKADKPNGSRVLGRKQALQELWQQLPVQDLPSCGGLVGDLAVHAQVHTAAQLRAALEQPGHPLAQAIAERCGSSVLATVRELSACSDPSPVQPTGAPATIQSQCSFTATELTSAPVPIPLWDLTQVQVHVRVLVCDVLARCVLHLAEHNEIPTKLNLSLVANKKRNSLDRGRAGDVQQPTRLIAGAHVCAGGASDSAAAVSRGASWMLQPALPLPGEQVRTDTSISKVFPVPTAAARWLSQQGGVGGVPTWLHALEGGDTSAAPPPAQAAADCMLAQVMAAYKQLLPEAALRLGWQLLPGVTSPPGGPVVAGGGAGNSTGGAAPLVLTKLNVAASAFSPTRNTLFGLRAASPVRAPKRQRSEAVGGAAAPQTASPRRPSQLPRTAASTPLQSGLSAVQEPAVSSAGASAAGSPPPSPQAGNGRAQLEAVAFPLSWRQFRSVVQGGGSELLLESIGVAPSASPT